MASADQHGSSFSMMAQKFLAGVLFALMLVKGMDLLVNSFMPVATPHPESKGGEVVAAPAAPAAPPAPEKPLAERMAAADAAAGAAIAKAKCGTCHTFNQGGKAILGPNLFGVFGRAKGSVSGFTYTDDFKKMTGNWTEEDLDHWVAGPKNMAAKTAMNFPGLDDGAQRADVIAYLKTLK